MTPTWTVERPRAVMKGGVDDAASLASQLGRPTLFSQVEPLPYAPDPIAFLGASSDALGGGILWDQPKAGIAYSGAGSAFKIRADGPERFSRVSEAMRDLSERLVRGDDGESFPCIGGFAFSERGEGGRSWRDYSDAMFVLPEVVLQVEGKDALLRLTLQVNPGSSATSVQRRVHDLLQRAREWANAPLLMLPDQTRIRRRSHPDRENWESSVATAIAMIRQHVVDKVVLAREERLLADRPFSPVSTL